MTLIDRPAPQPKSSRRRETTVPPYQRIEEEIRRRIEAGVWPAGAKLPSRKTLAQEYGVAVATMERALANLLADGSLRADGARGTFVGSESAEAPLSSRAAAPPLALPLLGQTKTTAMLGVFGTFDTAQPNGTDGFWLRTIANALEHVFSAAGGTSLVFNRREGTVPARAREAVRSLLQDGADAVAMVLIDDAAEIEVALEAVGGRVPLVFITSGPIRSPLAHVFYDNRDAGFQAAQHLIDCGYGPFWFFAPFEADWASERLLGAREAVQQAGLPASALTLIPSDRLPYPLTGPIASASGFGEAIMEYQAAGMQAARRAVAGALPGSGLIAADDYLGFDLLRAMDEAGRTAGADLGVVGFDDNPNSRLAGLTSLRPPLEALGQEAARMLLLALHGRQSGLQIRLRSQVVPRLSTRMGRSGG